MEIFPIVQYHCYKLTPRGKGNKGKAVPRH